MKTMKITLITALIVLGAMLFGQADMDQYTYVDNSETNSRFENLVSNFLSRTERTERDGYKEPVVFMSYTMQQADVVYEENYDTEAWMISPFECSMDDVEQVLESWMTAPFESKYADTDMKVELWMTVPFESNYAEAELAVENWMTHPFEAADHIEIESWMTAAF